MERHLAQRGLCHVHGGRLLRRVPTDWQRWTTFSLERSMAFETDSLASTRSVEFPVEAPADCEGMFDVLTYQKGGSLLRMLEQYLGAEGFRQGISLYLKTHAYGNTETGDLWDAIEKANPAVPVRTLMDSWIWQPGYPLISARLDGNELVLNQQRFSYTDTDDPTVFVVPMHLSIDGVESKLLLDSAQARRLSAVSRCDGGRQRRWSRLHPRRLRRHAAGPTRRRHADQPDGRRPVQPRRRRLERGHQRTARGGGLPRLRRGVPRQSRPRRVAGDRGRNPRASRIVDGPAYEALQKRIAGLVRPVIADLGWEPAEGESDLTSKLRGLIVALLAVQGNDTDAQARCRQMLGDESTDPELAAAAAVAVASVGTDLDFDQFVQRFRNAATPQLKYRFLYALAEFPNEDQTQRTIDLALSGEVKSQDGPFLLNRCIANRHNGVVAWERVRRQWPELVERFPDNTIVRMIGSITTLTEPHVVADVQGFFSEHPIPQAAKTLEQLLERQRVNADLRELESEPLTEALAGSAQDSA